MLFVIVTFFYAILPKVVFVDTTALLWAFPKQLSQGLKHTVAYNVFVCCRILFAFTETKRPKPVPA